MLGEWIARLMSLLFKRTLESRRNTSMMLSGTPVFPQHVLLQG